MLIAKQTEIGFEIDDHTVLFKHVIFPSSGPNEQFMTDHNCYKVINDRPIDANQKQVPCEPYLFEGSVYIVNTVNKTAEELQEEANLAKENLKRLYDSRLTQHFNTKAKERNYDNYVTCYMRNSFNGPFQAEGLAFANWVEQCNQLAYSTLASVEAGGVLPTVEAFIASLPELIWP
jgi:hypothetical protein